MAFITFEGIEGCGKTTQLRLLSGRMRHPPVTTVEPGGTELGRGIREILLRPAGRAIAPRAELLLFFADRAQHMEEIIVPALRAGRTVLCDRFGDSTVAYQGYGRGLPLERIAALQEWSSTGLRPDLTVLLDVPVDVGMARAAGRGNTDRIEGEERGFHERVREGFLTLASGDERWWVGDGTLEPDALARQVHEVVARHFPELEWKG